MDITAYTLSMLYTDMDEYVGSDDTVATCWARVSVMRCIHPEF